MYKMGRLIAETVVIFSLKYFCKSRKNYFATQCCLVTLVEKHYTSSNRKKLVHNKKLYLQPLKSGKYRVPNDNFVFIRYLWCVK